MGSGGKLSASGLMAERRLVRPVPFTCKLPASPMVQTFYLQITTVPNGGDGGSGTKKTPPADAIMNPPSKRWVSSPRVPASSATEDPRTEHEMLDSQVTLVGSPSLHRRGATPSLYVPANLNPVLTYAARLCGLWMLAPQQPPFR